VRPRVIVLDLWGFVIRWDMGVALDPAKDGDQACTIGIASTSRSARKPVVTDEDL